VIVRRASVRRNRRHAAFSSCPVHPIDPPSRSRFARKARDVGTVPHPGIATRRVASSGAP
jgi:hypothetical protein